MHRPPFREKISREGYTFTSIPPTRDDRRPSFLPSTVYKGEKNNSKRWISTGIIILFLSKFVNR